MFKMIKNIDFFESSNATKHTEERRKRIALAKQLINSESAKVLQYSICDTGHKNGLEVHVIYNNGIVFIYNMKTSKLITVLIARVPQIERYNIVVTKTMRKKINTHVAQGYNNIEF